MVLTLTDVKFLFGRERAGTILGLGANVAALLSVLLLSFMPETSQLIQKQINFKCNLFASNSLIHFLRPKHKINKVGGKAITIFQTRHHSFDCKLQL